MTELHRICVNHDSDLENLEDAVEFLNQFYIETRYPVHWPVNYDKKTAKKAEKYATEVKEIITSKTSN